MIIVPAAERIRPPQDFFKKMILERNNIWAAVFQFLGALNLPPSPSALFLPRVGPPCAGLFLPRSVHYLFSRHRAGGAEGYATSRL
jgi:hypothetical protein